MKKRYKSQTPLARKLRARRKSMLWSNDQPSDEAKARMKKWNEYLTELRHGRD